MDAEQPHAKQDGVPARRARWSGRTDLRVRVRVRVRVRACVCVVCVGGPCRESLANEMAESAID